MAVSRRSLRLRIDALEREARQSCRRLTAALQVAQWAADEFDQLKAAAAKLVSEMAAMESSNTAQGRAIHAMAVELQVKHTTGAINLHEWDEAQAFISLAGKLSEQA